MEIAQTLTDAGSALLSKLGLVPDAKDLTTLEEKRIRQVHDARVRIDSLIEGLNDEQDRDGLCEREIVVLPLDDHSLPLGARVSRKLFNPDSLKSQIFIDFFRELEQRGLRPFFKGSSYTDFVASADGGKWAPAVSIAIRLPEVGQQKMA